MGMDTDAGRKATDMNRKIRASLPRIQSLVVWYLIYTRKSLAKRAKKVKENLARIRKKGNQRMLPTMLVPRVTEKSRRRRPIPQMMSNLKIPLTKQIAARMWRAYNLKGLHLGGLKKANKGIPENTFQTPRVAIKSESRVTTAIDWGSLEMRNQRMMMIVKIPRRR